MDPAPFRQLAADPLKPAEAFWTASADGFRLRLAVWAAENARGTVLLFPGRTEYAEKYAPVAARLSEVGLSVIAIDWRGQGASARLLADPKPGHVGDFADYQHDVAALVAGAEELRLPRPWHLLAHSMGGCIGFRALIRGLPVASAAFSAPMWGVRIASLPPRVGSRVATGLAAAAGRTGRSARTVPGAASVLDIAFNENLLTGDIDEYTRFMREAATWSEWQLGAATWGWLGAAMAECRALAMLPAPDVPALISVSGREAIVLPSAIRARAAAWPGASLLELPEARHEALFEVPPVRAQLMEAILARFA